MVLIKKHSQNYLTDSHEIFSLQTTPFDPSIRKVSSLRLLPFTILIEALSLNDSSATVIHPYASHLTNQRVTRHTDFMRVNIADQFESSSLDQNRERKIPQA